LTTFIAENALSTLVIPTGRINTNLKSKYSRMSYKQLPESRTCGLRPGH
jgi:hypothetical protein